MTKKSEKVQKIEEKRRKEKIKKEVRNEKNREDYEIAKGVRKG